MTDTNSVFTETQVNAVKGVVVRVQPDHNFPQIHYLLLLILNEIYLGSHYSSLGKLNVPLIL